MLFCVGKDISVMAVVVGKGWWFCVGKERVVVLCREGKAVSYTHLTLPTMAVV